MIARIKKTIVLPADLARDAEAVARDKGILTEIDIERCLGRCGV